MAARANMPKAERLLNALGDPTRRAIVGGVSRRSLTVSELARSLNITVTAVGQHVAILEGCGLVSTRKVGRVRLCAFEAEGLIVLDRWIDHHRAAWAQSLDRLGDFLDEEDNA